MLPIIAAVLLNRGLRVFDAVIPEKAPRFGFEVGNDQPSPLIFRESRPRYADPAREDSGAQDSFRDSFRFHFFLQPARMSTLQRLQIDGIPSIWSFLRHLRRTQPSFLPPTSPLQFLRNGPEFLEYLIDSSRAQFFGVFQYRSHWLEK